MHADDPFAAPLAPNDHDHTTRTRTPRACMGCVCASVVRSGFALLAGLTSVLL